GAPRRRRQEGDSAHRWREAEHVPQRPQSSGRARDAVPRRVDVPHPLVGPRADRRACSERRRPDTGRRKRDDGRRRRACRAEGREEGEEDRGDRRGEQEEGGEGGEEVDGQVRKESGDEKSRQEEGEIAMPTKFEVVVRPHITEKTSAAYQDRTEYTFEVHPDA